MGLHAILNQNRPGEFLSVIDIVLVFFVRYDRKQGAGPLHSLLLIASGNTYLHDQTCPVG